MAEAQAPEAPKEAELIVNHDSLTEGDEILLGFAQETRDQINQWLDAYDLLGEVRRINQYVAEPLASDVRADLTAMGVSPAKHALVADYGQYVRGYMKGQARRAASTSTDPILPRHLGGGASAMEQSGEVLELRRTEQKLRGSIDDYNTVGIPDSMATRMEAIMDTADPAFLRRAVREQGTSPHGVLEDRDNIRLIVENGPTTSELNLVYGLLALKIQAIIERHEALVEQVYADLDAEARFGRRDVTAFATQMLIGSVRAFKSVNEAAAHDALLSSYDGITQIDFDAELSSIFEYIDQHRKYENDALDAVLGRTGIVADKALNEAKLLIEGDPKISTSLNFVIEDITNNDFGIAEGEDDEEVILAGVERAISVEAQLMQISDEVRARYEQALNHYREYERSLGADRLKNVLPGTMAIGIEGLTLTSDPPRLPMHEAVAENIARLEVEANAANLEAERKRLLELEEERKQASEALVAVRKEWIPSTDGSFTRRDGGVGAALLKNYRDIDDPMHIVESGIIDDESVSKFIATLKVLIARFEERHMLDPSQERHMLDPRPVLNELEDAAEVEATAVHVLELNRREATIGRTWEWLVEHRNTLVTSDIDEISELARQVKKFKRYPANALPPEVLKALLELDEKAVQIEEMAFSFGDVESMSRDIGDDALKKVRLGRKPEKKELPNTDRIEYVAKYYDKCLQDDTLDFADLYSMLPDYHTVYPVYVTATIKDGLVVLVIEGLEDGIASYVLAFPIPDDFDGDVETLAKNVARLKRPLLRNKLGATRMYHINSRGMDHHYDKIEHEVSVRRAQRPEAGDEPADDDVEELV